MLRSLYSSISGLQTHQVRMDIIGNNIANVNTTGYKAQRVTFEESFSQLLEGSSRPPGGSGGTNPVQVGLGTSIGSIDTVLGQGNVLATGQITDLAIEGEAYFPVSDGDGTYYTRNGSFQVDAGGKLVIPTNGFTLQGKIADADGEFPAGTVIDDIIIPFNEQAPAKGTTDISFSRNLNSDAGAKGSVMYTQKFLHHSEATDLATSMVNNKGENLGMQSGDTLTFAANFTALGDQTATLTITDTTTMDDIATALQNFIQGSGEVGVTAGVNGNAADPNVGSIELDTAGIAATISGLQITSDRPISNELVSKAFNFPTTIDATSGTVRTETMRAPAEATDLLSQLYDARGDDVSATGVGLETNDVITVNGSVGGESFDTTSLTYGTNTTTLQDLLNTVKDGLKLPTRDGTPANNLSVSINAAGSDDGIPDGSIVVRGAKGTGFAIENLKISATDANNSGGSPKLFNANMSMTTLQNAEDTGVFDTSISVFDDSGAAHVVTMTYTHTGIPGEWLWETSTAGEEEIIAGKAGKLTFGQDGSVASFTFNDNSSELVMDPNNGANQMRINLDVGGPGNFQGITQFEAPTTVSAISQDGFATGSLDEISIDNTGVITGSFSNGTSKKLAQILLVDFTNPGGLRKLSDSVYTVSANSGDPILGIAGTQSASTIKPGALEGSNVDLASQFTDMITTQRGYQANSRVITVSDSMLEELVALKR